MRDYELACIFKPDFVAKEVKTKIEEWMSSIGASVKDIDDWGVKKLAYPIKKFMEGHYVFVKFSSNPDKIGDMKRNLQLDQSLIRFLIIIENPLKPVKEKKRKIKTGNEKKDNLDEVVNKEV